jgi:hypothetical protein
MKGATVFAKCRRLDPSGYPRPAQLSAWLDLLMSAGSASMQIDALLSRRWET